LTGGDRERRLKRCLVNNLLCLLLRLLPLLGWRLQRPWQLALRLLL
jgi:hypothetical protein